MATLRDYRALLVRYLRPQRRRAALLAVLVLGTTGLQLAGPLMLRAFIDRAQAAAAMQTLVWMALGFLAVTLLTQFVTIAALWLSEQVGWAATNALRGDLALHCLRLDPTFHHTHTPGELIERIDGDTTALATFFSQFVIRIVGAALLLTGVLLLLMREDWRIGLGLGVYSALALFLLLRVRAIAVPHIARSQQASAEMFGFMEERLAGVEDIRANGAGEYTMHRLLGVMRHRFHRQVRAEMVGDSIWIFVRLFFLVAGVGSLAAGTWLYQSGAISLGTVYLLFQFTTMLRRPIELITGQLHEFQRAAASVGRIGALFAERSALENGTEPLPAGPLPVAFERVTFAYEGEPVLQDVSFRLEAGRTLGVLGRTGSGKTTLTRLLLRLYDVERGQVRVAGSDVRTLDIDRLRGRAGVVTQEVQVFRASLRDNLTLFDPSIPDEQVRRVLNDLGLAHWVESLPDGLDSELAGDALSAGEAQLIAFGRVFLRDPGLVILDEASSRLDPATETLIERAVDRLLAGRTAIIIAHRLGTVQRADDILILEDGQVQEFGPRSVLAADPVSRLSALLGTGMQEALAS